MPHPEYRTGLECVDHSVRHQRGTAVARDEARHEPGHTQAALSGAEGTCLGRVLESFDIGLDYLDQARARPEFGRETDSSTHRDVERELTPLSCFQPSNYERHHGLSIAVVEHCVRIEGHLANFASRWVAFHYGGNLGTTFVWWREPPQDQGDECIDVAVILDDDAVCLGATCNETVHSHQAGIDLQRASPRPR